MQTLFEILTSEENVAMQYELVIILCAFFASASLIRNRKKLTAVWTVIFLFFAYLHRILLPFLVSGIYLLVLGGVICAVIKLDFKGLLLPFQVLQKKGKVYMASAVVPYTAVILTILLIQLCRINIGIDYDSIRYGLRSDVLLTNGGGIFGFFQNTGLVNSVYVYPKGFEVLTRPLYIGNTYGFVLCANIWMLIAVILLSGELTYTVAASREIEVFAAMMTALVPGITNMSITAKSDLITCACQMVFILCVMRYLAQDKANRSETLPAETGVGIGALILSYAFKPTAFIFSSVIGIAAIVYFAVRKIRLRFCGSGIRALVPAVAFTAVMCVRTWMITGQPVASVFTGMFEMLGLKLKYPFRSQTFLYEKETEGILQKIQGFLSRLLHFLFCPTGEDMEHVIMAWGGLAFVILLLLTLLFVRGTKEKMAKLDRLAIVESKGYRFSAEAFDFLRYIWIVMGVLSLISLYMLYQVDGNYFMLIYALTVIMGSLIFFAAAQYELSPLGQDLKRHFSGGNSLAILLLSVVMIYFTAFTGWSGATGFTKIDWINKGYYPHVASFQDGSGIWGEQERILAMAYDPECYEMKGRVESWVDIDGTGGNVYLTDTKFNIFKEYLAFADIDYIYADLNYLQDDSNERRARAAELFVWLLEDGSFEEVFLFPYSSNQIAAKLNKERVAVDWETPISAELSSKIEAQKQWFDEIK